MLTSRERCLRAIEHEIPDRVPLILRIRPEPLSKLLRVLDSDYIGLIRFLKIDVLFTGVGLKGGFTPKDGAIWKEGGYVVKKINDEEIRRSIFGYETLWKPKRTHTYSFYKHPLQYISLKDYPWPEVREEDFSKIINFRKKYEDYFIYSGVVQCFETAWKLTGFNEFMRMMLCEPSKVEYILGKLYRIAESQAKLALDAGVDAIVNGDDVGMQKGMIISPRLWRRFLKPIYHSLAKLIHRRGGFFVFHSDGWIEPIIADLIDIGVDILTPVQPECMDVYRLKKLYGDKLCFDGTISIQRTMSFSDIMGVEKEVKERIKMLGPTGLILGPGHSLQPEVPIENIIALYKAAYKYGRFQQ